MTHTNKFHIIALVFAICILEGCASARPYKYNGNYYMVGDPSCSKFNQRYSNAINCFNSDGEATGYRTAMTDQDMQMYIASQAQEDRNNKEQQRQNDRQNDKNHELYCSNMPKGTYGCNN